MDDEEFWGLIEGSRRQSEDPDDRLDWLRGQLMQRSLPEIVRFKVRLDEARVPIDNWPMWAAAGRIYRGFCSDDSFWYFQVWLIGLGREAYQRAAADPDSLAELPEVRRLAGRPMDSWADEEFPDWESLDYVAAEAYEELTGEEDGLEDAMEAAGLESPACPEPSGEPWRGEGETARRLPRLTALFPVATEG